ncbi:hypothetical protein FNF31_04508 [Cafeteria roenbergensis]|uniref:Uncharacterized protein n=1 Tax=Cafeteria roenbergensis TaxID=33653 RepID=A0A5A8D554_CAFRO|nr:hypothetical protein FNF31_04508 [Cafeteria roenbergensis]
MAFWSSAAVKAYIDENNKGIQTYCLVVLATFAIGSLLLVLASVLLPLLFALFLSLHFSPLIELLECKRGPRCLRECNMPCRRATKDAVKLCKGPDNEFKNNIYNGFVEGVVDLFCGLKFPAWLAILTTFGVIIGFFIIIGVIVSDSINGLLNDRDKWVSQWEKLNNQVAELAAQQGFTVTSEDINKGATEFLLNNVVTPLTSLLPSIITYTFLTLAFLVFVLVSPSTFFGDSDALTTTDPDELSCSDDEVPDDELAAAVDNVITAQAAAILISCDCWIGTAAPCP